MGFLSSGNRASAAAMMTSSASMFRRPQRPGVGFANVAGGTSSVDPVLHLLELIIAGSAAGSQGATRPFIGELSRADVGA
jgi:hypothetical protein